MVAARQRNFLQKLCAASSTINQMLSTIDANALGKWKPVFGIRQNNRKQKRVPSSKSGKRAGLF
jgi:hypothetical protein